MQLIKRDQVQLRKVKKLDYDRLAKAIEAQKLDKDHVLAVSSKELKSILGSKRNNKDLARLLSKKLKLNCVFDGENDRYIFSVE